MANGVKLAAPVPLLVPILRAGIGMLDGMARLLPKADIGFVGLVRDEETLVASTYATRLPADLTGRQTLILDPMLATGGSHGDRHPDAAQSRRGCRHRRQPARRAGRPGAGLPRRSTATCRCVSSPAHWTRC